MAEHIWVEIDETRVELLEVFFDRLNEVTALWSPGKLVTFSSPGNHDFDCGAHTYYRALCKMFNLIYQVT